MTDISIGDSILITKGSSIFEVGYQQNKCLGLALAKRDTTATVSTVINDPENWVTFLSLEQQARINSIAGRFDNISHVLHWLERGYILRDLGAAVEQNLRDTLRDLKVEYDNHFGPNPVFIGWGSGGNTKAAILRDVTKIETVVKVPKEQKITKRRQMVVGSRWQFSHDITITREVYNPKINELCRQRDRLRNGNWQGIQDQINELVKTKPRVTINVAQITAGSIIRITQKPQSGFYDRGMVICADLESGQVDLADQRITRGKIGHIPCAQIEPVIEALEVPETLVYVLRDSATGDFFGGWETEVSGHYNQAQQTEVPKMVKTFSSSKKYKTSSAAKASVRDFTGYNEGLDDEGAAEEWVGIGYGSKKIDLPSTWEMVAIDKTTNTEKKIIDLQIWYRELMRLRELTVQHGSGLRAAYKKAEGKPELDTIVVVTNIPTEIYGGKSHTQRQPFDRDAQGITSLNNIREARARAITGKSYVVTTPATVAIACEVMDATLFVLALTDPALSVSAYDIATLSELTLKKGDVDVATISG